MPDVKVKFVAGFGPIVKDGASKALYGDALPIPLAVEPHPLPLIIAALAGFLTVAGSGIEGDMDVPRRKPVPSNAFAFSSLPPCSCGSTTSAP